MAESMVSTSEPIRLNAAFAWGVVAWVSISSGQTNQSVSLFDQFGQELQDVDIFRFFRIG